MKRRQKSELELSVEALLGPRELAILNFANEVQDWMQPRYEALWSLDPTDVQRIHQWMLDTLDAASDTFDLSCPASTIVSTAENYAKPEDSRAPAYLALWEAAQQQYEVGRIHSRVAYEEDLWDALLEPLNVEDDICFSDILPDVILLGLVGKAGADAAEATWRTIEMAYTEKFGEGPSVDKQDFLARVRIHQKPRQRSQWGA